MYTILCMCVYYYTILLYYVCILCTGYVYVLHILCAYHCAHTTVPPHYIVLQYSVQYTMYVCIVLQYSVWQYVYVQQCILYTVVCVVYYVCVCTILYSMYVCMCIVHYVCVYIAVYVYSILCVCIHSSACVQYVCTMYYTMCVYVYSVVCVCMLCARALSRALEGGCAQGPCLLATSVLDSPIIERGCRTSCIVMSSLGVSIHCVFYTHYYYTTILCACSSSVCSKGYLLVCSILCMYV